MFFYNVLPASSKFSSREPLKYSSDEDIENGQVVSINFRKFLCNGIVLSKTPKPDFKTQNINGIYKDVVLPQQSLELLDWIRSYYPGPLGNTGQLFVPASLKNSNTTQKTLAKTQIKQLPKLTKDQQAVLKNIGLSQKNTFLLHGATGSGKTRVYIELAKKCLDKGRSAIILTPEISLTPQLVKSFNEVFAGKVLMTHSNLTAKERTNIWLKCLRGGPWIILGPRSAIFCPVNRLGLVVIDESHDSAYKQDSSPFYQTHRVASFLARQTRSTIVMGSATPSVNEYFLAIQKDIPILKMSKSALSNENSHKVIKTVDMTDKDNLSKSPLLSQPLIKELGYSLKNGGQSMVFINKRGDSKSITCQDCGWQAKCSNCDLPLTYHSDRDCFSCHTCGKNYQSRTSCELCGSANIIFKNPGTKAVASYLAKLFPSANIARFDTDNKKVERIDSRYKEIADGEIDILVGTQILTKGHDLPRLSLAAMLVSESGLSFPDYTAEERTYQTIQQLCGRVGRGHISGKVILQSFNPKNSLLDQAIQGDYESFYSSQINERRLYGFPPFYHVMKISSPRASSSSSLKSANKIKDAIKTKNPRCMILGPSPAFYFKKSGKYNWQLIIKAKARSDLTNIINELPTNHTANIDPSNLL